MDLITTLSVNVSSFAYTKKLYDRTCITQDNRKKDLDHLWALLMKATSTINEKVEKQAHLYFKKCKEGDILFVVGYRRTSKIVFFLYREGKMRKMRTVQVKFAIPDFFANRTPDGKGATYAINIRGEIDYAVNLRPGDVERIDHNMYPAESFGLWLYNK